MKRLLILLALTFFQFNSYAQCCPYIDSVEVIPEFPNEGEDTKVVITVTTPNQGSFIEANASVSGLSVNIEACYYSGFLTALQTYVDTLNLGLLSAGEYDLSFTAFQSDNPEICNQNDSQSLSDSFVVTGVDNIIELERVELVLYPNPNSSGKLLFDTEQNIVDVEIYNIEGKLVKKIRSEKKLPIQELNIDDLPIEAYVLHISLANGQKIMRELIRQ